MFAKGASPEFKKHAWGILVIGCLAMYFSCCLSTDALNVLQPVFTELGWSYSQLSMPMTIGGYILVAVSFLFSTFMIKNGTRFFTTASFACLAIGTFIIAFAYTSDSYVIYFIGAMITKVGCTAVQMGIFQICATWFDTTRGRVLGIVTMAAPLNSASSTTILTLGTGVFGFTFTYIILGAVLIAATVLAYMFSQSSPAELGLLPDGIVSEYNGNGGEMPKPVLTAKQILTQRSTWTIMVAFGIFNGTISAVMAFFITRMTEVGVSTTVALSILSAASILGIPLSYAFGFLDDKFGTLKADIVLGICYIVMCICFLFGSAGFMLPILIAAVGMGAMTGGCPNLHPSTIMHVFGATEYQNANRFIAIGISLISTFGTQLMSACMDASGTLNTGYLVFGVLAVIGTIMILLTRKVNAEELAPK